jgi:hypothetical protein
MSTIYGLFVGIDKYQPPVPPLDGCVNDMRAFRDYIQRRAQVNGMDFQEEVLENDQATRLNIVQKFETHLRKAQDGDIAVFYYSGHGSQEPAHPLFYKIESDKLNETLVCYDSRQFDGMDLADKELATLLSLVAKNNPHLLVVTDCCNSGENTRSVELKPNDVKVRQSPDYTKFRDLDSYILSDDVIPKTRGMEVSEEATRIMVPHSRHVHLAATHSHQLAKETHLGGSPRGVFTYSLLEVLENAVGPISYLETIRRVRSLVRKRTFEQDPQMSVYHEGDDSLQFLNGQLTEKSHYYNLEFSREKGWTMDAGTIHGISAGNARTGELALLNVYPTDASAEEMNDPANALGQVAVSAVSATNATVRPEGDLFLDTNSVYRARIAQMPVEQMNIHIRGANEEGVRLAQEALVNDPQAAVFLQETSRGLAAYHLIANEHNEYIIIRSTDTDDQPLVEQIDGFTPENAQKAIDYLEHIAKWEKVLALSNPNSMIFSDSVRIEVVPLNADTPYIPEGGNYEFSYNKADGRAGLPRFRIKIVNTSGRDLYCSLMYMGALFDVNANMLHNKGIWIKNGEEAWAMEGKAFIGTVEEEFYQMGRKAVESYFKLVYSTKDFDASLMEQAELNKPKIRLRSIAEEGEVKSRGLLFDDSFATANQDDWNATDLSIIIRRTD